MDGQAAWRPITGTDGSGFPKAEETTLSPRLDEWMQMSDTGIQLIRGDWLAAVTRKDDHWEWRVVGFRAGHPVHPGMGEDTTVDACITAAEARLATLAPNPRLVVWERSNGMMIGHPYKSARPPETRPDSE